MITTEEAELLGALVGDGNIYTNHGKYLIAFTGNAKKEVEYFQYLSDLISIVWSKKVTPKIRSNGVRIAVYSKNAVLRFKDVFGVPTGAGKCEKVFIPPIIFENWAYCKYFIRGVFDTDGSLFISNKKGSPEYPSIEFTTTSNKLVRQFQLALSMQGFRTTKIWQYCSRNSNRTTYKFGLNGIISLQKWVSEIGFLNPAKRLLAQKILANTGCAQGCHSQCL